MIRTWHIVKSGYSQTEGHLHGCQRLWLELKELSNPQTQVALLPWNHDFDSYAERIRLTSKPDVRILCYDYSWGSGNGLLRFAEGLQKRALTIDHAVLSDPVYHSQKFEAWPGIGHLMRGLGVLLQRKITIPDNVKRVSWFRQLKNIPKGCDLVAANKTKTLIADPIILDYPHEAMDDAPEWHQRCREIAGLVD